MLARFCGRCTNRRKLRVARDHVLNYAVSPEFRRAHRDRRIRKLGEELRKLENFGEREKLEVQAKLYSRISTGLFCGIYLLTLGGAGVLLVVVGLLSVLEREIMEQPLPNIVTHWPVTLYGLPFIALFALIAFSFITAELEAEKLPPKFRDRRINKLRKKLVELGGEPKHRVRRRAADRKSIEAEGHIPS